MSNIIKYSIAKCSTGESFDFSQSAYNDIVGNTRSFSITQCARLPDTIYYSAPYTARCEVGYDGSEVTVAAGAFTSYVSQQAADAQALAYAEGQLVCYPPYVPPSINGPISLIRDIDGFLLITEYYGGRVLRMDPAGVLTVVSESDPAAEGLAQDSDGIIYVGVSGTGTLRKILRDGTKTDLVTDASIIPSVLAASDGFIYLSAYSHGEIWKVSKTGDRTTLVSGLYAPRSIIEGADGDLYVADEGNNRIIRVTKVGVVTVVSVGISNPYGLMQATDGYLYVCGRGDSNVWKIDTLSNTKVSLTSGIGLPSAIAEGASNILYVSGTSDNSVWEVHPNGSKTKLSTTVQGPRGLIVADGDLYVAGLGENRIVKLSI